VTLLAALAVIATILGAVFVQWLLLIALAAAMIWLTVLFARAV
jgi:hypothetical protein